MMRNEIRFHVEKRPWVDGVAVYAFTRRDDQTVSVGQSVTFVDRPAGVAADYNDPTLHLNYESAQMLMDSLWDCGLRPSEGSGSAGAMAATQKHLEDMRRLVFKELK
jgi:hypothetical protein